MTALYDIKIQEKRDNITDEEYVRIIITYLGNKEPDEFFDTTKLRHISVNGASLSQAMANAATVIEQHFAEEKGKA